LGDTVYIKKCEEYDRDSIKEIVREGMEALSYKPSGNVFVKPNVVFASDPKIFGNNAHTPNDFLAGSILAISDKDDVKRVDVGENGAIGAPTRLFYKGSGYYDEIKKLNKEAKKPVGIFCMDEELRDPVFVGGKVHDVLRVSRKMNRADTKVYLPKLKVHCVSNMTATVKLNIGICSDDERSIRHDFMLNEKIVDLLGPGYPDFIVMDAINVGVGNEAFPIMRKLGLVIMGTNPVAVDLVAARLLGFSAADVPYLQLAIDRGYTPEKLEDVKIEGDLTSIDDLDEQAKRLQPYDEEFYRWQDVNTELERLNSPMRFYWGPYRHGNGDKCLTGCVMGIKMFLGSFEKTAGPEAFANATPAVFVIGQVDEEIDAKGEEVFMLGTCARANIKNAKKITHIQKCFTTASDMHMSFGHKLGMKSMLRDPVLLAGFATSGAAAVLKKTISGRYLQDIAYFLTKRLDRRL
jgi:uncharacterized protein (DUF362 family)